MKFMELPEGCYQLTDVHELTNTVFVQLFENPDAIPLALFIPEPIEVVHDCRSYNNRGYFFPKNLDAMEVEFKDYGQVRKEKKSRGASYGHVKRRINSKERLVGKTLEVALGLLGDGNSGDVCRDTIANKLIAGEDLSDYEQHIMVDVFLLHARLR